MASNSYISSSSSFERPGLSIRRQQSKESIVGRDSFDDLSSSLDADLRRISAGCRMSATYELRPDLPASPTWSSSVGAGQPGGDFSLDQHARFNILLGDMLDPPRRQHENYDSQLEARVASKRGEAQPEEPLPVEPPEDPWARTQSAPR